MIKIDDLAAMSDEGLEQAITEKYSKYADNGTYSIGMFPYVATTNKKGLIAFQLELVKAVIKYRVVPEPETIKPEKETE